MFKNQPYYPDFALLLLRLAAGGLMLQHGYSKFTQLMAGDYGFADPIGIGEMPSLVLTVFSEFFCAILVVVGFQTRLATVPLIITMLVAALVVHAADPLGDKEPSLMYASMYAAIYMMGGGRYSLDAMLRRG
ncbi:MAG: DoxX family protein [Saprospiraceae bacterium]|nr:DoxX family protein [Saprospiraceae bacterium]